MEKTDETFLSLKYGKIEFDLHFIISLPLDFQIKYGYAIDEERWMLSVVEVYYRRDEDEHEEWRQKLIQNLWEYHSEQG